MDLDLSQVRSERGNVALGLACQPEQFNRWSNIGEDAAKLAQVQQRTI